jgi:hypothetical protein
MLKGRVHLQLTNSSMSRGKLRSKWRTCAVVSNSGVMKKHTLGSDIDAADLVIRFNDAPTAGYTKIVGSKEGVRFINGAQANYITLYSTNRTVNASNGISYAVVPMTSAPNLHSLRRRFSDVEWFQIDRSVQKSFFTLLEEIYWSDRFVFHEGGRTIATSGAMGMLTALSMCDEVRAYGMASSPSEYGAYYHYYDTGGNAYKNYFHKAFNIEKDLWRRLATNPPKDIDKTDVVVIPGFSRAKCPP